MGDANDQHFTTDSIFGLSADASVGVGLGENILIGGNNSAFVLQPTSYEGQVGLNVAAGVTTVTLTWAQ